VTVHLRLGEVLLRLHPGCAVRLAITVLGDVGTLREVAA